MDSRGLRAAYETATDEVFLFFLEFNHESLDEPFRFVGSKENHSHNGHDYIGYPFALSLPISDGETVPTVRLTVGNVDRVLTETIRSVQGDIEITYWVALASDPDTIQEGPFVMTLVDVATNALSISGNISSDSILGQSACDYKMTPVTTPSLFKGVAS